jgi:tyrosine-specific transport protein
MIASWAALTFFAGWSLATGLIIAEVSLATLCEIGGGKGISLSSTAERTIGTVGSTAVSATYLLLHYTLLVAYTVKAGSTLTTIAPSISLTVGEVAFVSVLGLLCFGTPSKTLEKINNVLVLLFIGSFLALLSTAIPGVDVERLLNESPRWEALPSALPVIALAFVYQNTVPLVVSSLEGDPGKIRKSLCIGVFIAYLMFVSWNAAILGSGGGGGGDIDCSAIVDPLAALRSSRNPLLGPLVDTFSLLAVTTSFIGFVLGLSDFFADVLKLPTGSKTLPVFALTLMPPTVLAILFPDVFYKALDFAGTYGVLVLFGLIPVAMAYGERGTVLGSERGEEGNEGSVEFVPGWLLPLLGIVPVVVIFDQLTTSLH